MKHRPGVGVFLVAALCLLASCGSPAPRESTTASPDGPTTVGSPGTEGPTTRPFESVRPKFGALSTILLYCTPGLPGSPRDGCDSGRIRKGLTELTSAIKKDIIAASEPAQYADVSAAVAELEKSTAELRQCDDYFKEGVGQRECSVAWGDVDADFDALASAAHYT